jgi:hypothetical protein
MSCLSQVRSLVVLLFHRGGAARWIVGLLLAASLVQPSSADERPGEMPRMYRALRWLIDWLTSRLRTSTVAQWVG